ncbi:MAG: hypothetical protein EOM80_00955 [Erysipelotrichia bacterium]|nr:hypothetical protein [Erysipelotrichia bacterium]
MMKSWQLYCFMICFCSLNLSVESHAQVIVAENKNAVKMRTAFPETASGSFKIQKTDKSAEGYVFPVTAPRRRPAGKVERILTGVFDQKGLRESTQQKTDVPDVEEKLQKTSQKMSDSIAWVTTLAFDYHAPFLSCESAGEKVWVSSIKDLCGFSPCETCFIKPGRVPEFIQNECGGLDLASSSALLTNEAFQLWAVENLPVVNPSFISLRKLQVYPKTQMSDAGLKELAREVELAYRRHTWKVIEVVVKKSETDPGLISSFGDGKPEVAAPTND